MANSSVKIIAILSLKVALGLALTTLGLFVYICFPSIHLTKLYQNLVINEESLMYKSWLETDVPVYMQFYFFNVVNPKEFSRGKEMPKLVQLGPYTYFERRRKENVTFSDDLQTVNYRMIKSFSFLPDKTEGSLNDTITILNIPLVAAAQKIEGKNSYIEFMLWNALAKSSKEFGELFLKKTVKELLFDGYEDALMRTISEKKKIETLPDWKFAFFYKVNNSGSVFSTKTGYGNISELASVIAWNKTASDVRNVTEENCGRLPFWNDTYCDTIKGSDGSQFPPNIKKESKLKVFVFDLCRSMHLEFNENTKVRDIPTYRFSLPEEVFDHPNNKSETKCFAPKEELLNSNISGIFYMGPCRLGAPIVTSLPYFQKTVLQQSDIINLTSDENLSSFIDIEPRTGLPMKVSNKMQINIILKRLDDTIAMRKLPKQDVLFPVLWINESFELTEEKAEIFKGNVIRLPVVISIASLMIVIIGAFVTLVSIGCFFQAKQSNKVKNFHPKY